MKRSAASQPHGFPTSSFSSGARLSRRQLLAMSMGGAVTASLSVRAIADETDGEEASDSASVGETAGSDSPLTYTAPQTQAWRFGLKLSTPVTCTSVFATFPVPMDWPEQTVKLTGQQIDPLVTGWETRDLPGGARQVALQMPRVLAGQTAEIMFDLEIERSKIVAPETTDQFVIPSRTPRELRIYTGSSPYIDASHGLIRTASRELAEMPAETAWQRVEQIYDYVREKVKYTEGPIKNASDALREGSGDCEELTSLFVALCRNAEIPARMVWIPDHCYPEFYLEDASGKGYWFPCQAAGTRQFGEMDEYRPVLQKGDRFKVAERRTPMRYVSEFFKCDRLGRGKPRPDFVREQIRVS